MTSWLIGCSTAGSLNIALHRYVYAAHVRPFDGRAKWCFRLASQPNVFVDLHTWVLELAEQLSRMVSAIALCTLSRCFLLMACCCGVVLDEGRHVSGHKGKLIHIRLLLLCRA